MTYISELQLFVDGYYYEVLNQSDHYVILGVPTGAVTRSEGLSHLERLYTNYGLQLAATFKEGDAASFDGGRLVLFKTR